MTLGEEFNLYLKEIENSPYSLEKEEAFTKLKEMADLIAEWEEDKDSLLADVKNLTDEVSSVEEESDNAKSDFESLYADVTDFRNSTYLTDSKAIERLTAILKRYEERI